MGSPLLDRPRPLHDQDARRPLRMGHVLATDLGKEDVARLQQAAVLLTGLAPAHLDAAVEHGKHLRPIVDVPAVGRVGPVQTDGDAVERG